jgi:hypothetical protein
LGLSDWLPISNYPRDLGPELHRDEQVTKYRPYLTSIGVVAGGLKIAVEEVPSRLAGQDLGTWVAGHVRIGRDIWQNA